MNPQPLYRLPPRLKAGDRIRIVAPSGPVDRERFMRGVAMLQDWGLRPVFSKRVFTRTGYLAGDDELRLAELNAALADPEAAAIWCGRGGYGMTRLLPLLEPGRIAERPRWLVGFSDITPLHALWQRAGWQSLHGAVMTNLADWGEAARGLLRGWLFDGVMPALTGTALSGDRPVVGPVLGGNLTVLASLAGTPYLPDLRGAIVFLEDVGERPYRLDRYLTQLVQAGAFIGTAGFVIGQLTDCVDPPGKDDGCNALDAVHAVLEPLGLPILAELPVGHENSSLPLPLGAPAVLDPSAATLSFSDQAGGVARRVSGR